MIGEILSGLRSPQKRLPAKLFYDEAGAALFERITELPEYYPTRTETAILESAAPRIAELAGPGVMLIEFGSGASRKTRILLDSLVEPAVYVPIDVSPDYLEPAAAALRLEYPNLAVEPLLADYQHLPDLPLHPGARRKLAFFPGSTIGNLTRAESCQFLERVARLVAPEGAFLLGLDLVKPLDVLLPAYDDAAGVTRAFNLNVAHRLNREFGGTLDLALLEHQTRWNEAESRIEMHLAARAPHSFTVAGETFSLQAGETILTEYSHKFRLEDLPRFAPQFCAREVFLDERSWFAGVYLEPLHAPDASRV
jgi:dimethylhistidine N-methyltransferase